MKPCKRLPLSFLTVCYKFNLAMHRETPIHDIILSAIFYTPEYSTHCVLNKTLGFLLAFRQHFDRAVKHYPCLYKKRFLCHFIVFLNCERQGSLSLFGVRPCLWSIRPLTIGEILSQNLGELPLPDRVYTILFFTLLYSSLLSFRARV